MHPLLKHVSEVVLEYCSLIESAQEANGQWLEQLEELLPHLHVAIAVLDGFDDYVDLADVVDLDDRFELYVELHQLLGKQDGYWMAFDVAQDGQSMTGSLADDLTDIYCELKRGLALLEHEPKRAFSGLRTSYAVHWGRHLVDAERHLIKIRQGRLESA